MGAGELLALVDDVGLAAVVVVLLLRLERRIAALTAGLTILVERTRGLRVVREARRVTVTLEPPLPEDAIPEEVAEGLTGRMRSPPR